ncbi:MAG: hypothetical protein WC866_00320 [Patescibacteria group bacterium]|jgi:hypothetical protein
MKNTIRQIYFYAATLIFLIMSVIAAISLLNLGMKTYVFTKADFAYNSCDMGYARPMPVAVEEGAKQPSQADLDAQKSECEKNQEEQRDAQRQNSLAQYIAMLVVSAPLFVLHFKWVQKERETELKMNA